MLQDLLFYCKVTFSRAQFYLLMEVAPNKKGAQSVYTLIRTSGPLTTFEIGGIQCL